MRVATDTGQAGAAMDVPLGEGRWGGPSPSSELAPDVAPPDPARGLALTVVAARIAVIGARFAATENGNSAVVGARKANPGSVPAVASRSHRYTPCQEPFKGGARLRWMAGRGLKS